MTIYLTPIPTSGDITVTVRDSHTGAAIAGASVSGGGYSGTANSSGSLTFADIPLGCYTFTASKSGYFDNSNSGAIDATNFTDRITI